MIKHRTAAILFSILLILTLAVTAVESAAVSFSLENSFSREKTKALAQHQLVKYSIQAAVLSSAQDGGVSAAELPIIGEKAAALLGCILPETEARSTTPICRRISLRRCRRRASCPTASSPTASA